MINKVLSLFLAACWTCNLSAQSYDVILRNGRVADGTGNPAFFADVAIKDGKVAAVGRVQGDAKQVIEAKGLIIAPGFVDVHTHAEEIEDHPLAENFLRMGVTTLVLGNCGGSRLNVGEYFRKLEDMKISPNVCTLIGHNTVRSKAMGGSFMRPPTDEELSQMKHYVDQAMKDGAVGLSTGLIYLPGVFAKTEEIIELAKVASAYGGIYASHQRSEGSDIFNSLQEVFRIAREANIRAEISHIKLAGKANWNQTDKVLAAIDLARAEGLDITQDQYAYAASSTGLGQLIPEEAREGGKFKERLANPEEKKKIIDGMKKNLQSRGSESYAFAVIASHRADKSLNGLNVVEAAKKLRNSDTLDDQLETILEIEKNGGASAVFHGMSEDDLREFMKHPNTMFASDSGIRVMNESVPHPRGYGNNARILGRYVRDEKILRMEEAVRKMSSLPATTFRLKDRGLVREGYWADLVVFDPNTVMDHSAYKDPHHYSTGFKQVFVNGVLVVENDRHTQARPGKTLRLN